MKSILFGSLVGILVLACVNKNQESPNFKGTYVFSPSPLQDSLFIINDSVYIHKYWASRNEYYKAEGKWIYDPDGQEILFKKFVFFNDEGPSTPAGNWYSKVRISEEGQMDFMYSQESNIFFRRIVTTQ